MKYLFNFCESLIIETLALLNKDQEFNTILAFDEVNKTSTIWNTTTNAVYISVLIDIALYLWLIFIIIQFGIYYNRRSTYALLSLNKKYTEIFLVLIFFILTLVFFKTNNYQDIFLVTENYSISYYSQFVKLFSILIFYILFQYIDSIFSYEKNKWAAEIAILTYFALCLNFTLISSANFALFVICLEGLSLLLYIIATIGRSYGGVFAAIKYFAFSTIGSILILWGSVNVFASTSSLSLRPVAYLFKTLSLNNLLLIPYEWVPNLIIIGLLIKLGAAPLHQWVSDVYAGVPLWVTSFYSIFIKFILYFLLLKIFYVFYQCNDIEFVAVSSLIIGCLGALRQLEIKRLLAYGSITHVGFLLMGDFAASIVYMLTYIVSLLLFFSVIMLLKLNKNEFVYISDLRYIKHSKKEFYRTILVLSLMSMAGLPPLAGFYGKLMVWSSLIEDIYLFNDFTSYLLFIINIVLSMFIIFYYIRLVSMLYLHESDTLSYDVGNKCFAGPNFIVRSYLAIFDKNSVQSHNLTEVQMIFLLILLFWTALMPYVIDYVVYILGGFEV